jgi:Na+-translocating ferredoxin:NAD+ oxidoreductase RnfD subunit
MQQTAVPTSAPSPPVDRAALSSGRIRTADAELMHGGVDVSRFVGMYALGAIFPITAGLLVFGWRALGALTVVAASTLCATFVWRRIGARGWPLRYDHALWTAMLLSMALPADLFSANRAASDQTLLWPMLAAAGVLLVIFNWLLGGLGAGRVHPVLVTYLLVFVCFKDLLVPHYVLQRKHMFVGDLYRAMPAEMAEMETQPWIRAADVRDYDSIRTDPPAQTLLWYTTGGGKSAQRMWVSLDSLLRDRMPPLEDLIVAGQPAPIGLGSAIALIIGGLFLLYRGLIDYRVPLIIIVSALAAIVVLPVPVRVTESEAFYQWLVLRSGAAGWPVGLTLASYELMAGPLMFTAFFLATSPEVRPITRRARTVYSVIVGLLTGVFQLYVSVAIGAYLALLAASLVTPTFDKWFRPRTLV